MRVLISAYACEPNKGSEPGVGWSLATAIARDHEVWVLTTATHRFGIEKELAQLGTAAEHWGTTAEHIARIHWVYLDPLGWVYDWNKGGKGIQWDVHLHHYLWQIAAYFKVKRLHRSVQFEIIHHGTYGRYSAPSFLAFLPIPFVWGPVGGAEAAPIAFWKDFNLKGKIYEVLRQVARLSGEWDPFVQLTARKSAIALVCTPETGARLQSLGVPRLEWVSGQTGLSLAELDQLQALKAQQQSSGDRPVRFLSLGRLIHWKGFHLGLQAFLNANVPNTEYWIAGTGAEEGQLRSLVEQARVQQNPAADRVQFLGALPRSQALAVMADCDVLVHPSLHDFSPTVCIEAMAAGLPVICLDLGGPSVQITDETGIRVEAIDRDRSIQGLAAAMKDLATQPDRCQRMGQAGQARVREFYCWETRGQIYSQLYRSL